MRQSTWLLASMSLALAGCDQWIVYGPSYESGSVSAPVSYGSLEGGSSQDGDRFPGRFGPRQTWRDTGAPVTAPVAALVRLEEGIGEPVSGLPDVLVGNVAYFGGDAHVFKTIAYDVAAGTRLWTRTEDPALVAGTVFGDGQLLCGSLSRATGQMACLNASDGSLRWRADAYVEDGLILDGRVIVESQYGLKVFDAQTGALQWSTYKPGIRGITLVGGRLLAYPCDVLDLATGSQLASYLTEARLLWATDSEAYLLGTAPQTGTVYLRYDAASNQFADVTGEFASFVAPRGAQLPIVGMTPVQGDGAVYGITTDFRNLCRIDTATRQISWCTGSISGLKASLQAFSNLLLFDGNAYDLETGGTVSRSNQVAVFHERWGMERTGSSGVSFLEAVQ